MISAAAAVPAISAAIRYLENVIFQRRLPRTPEGARTGYDIISPGQSHRGSTSRYLDNDNEQLPVQRQPVRGRSRRSVSRSSSNEGIVETEEEISVLQ